LFKFNFKAAQRKILRFLFQFAKKRIDLLRDKNDLIEHPLFQIKSQIKSFKKKLSIPIKSRKSDLQSDFTITQSNH